MTQPVVSQEEIAALLEGYSVERLATGPELPRLARDPSDTDFIPTGPDPSPSDTATETATLPELDAIHRQFALALSSRLSTMTCNSIWVRAQPTQIQESEQLLSGGPVQIHYFNLRRPTGSCMMVLQTAWLRSYVDLLFGGDGRSGPGSPGDELSSTQQQVARKLLALLCQQYMLAWRSRHALQLQWRRSESSMATLRDAARGEALLGTALDMRAAEATGRVWILFPQATLLQLSRQLESVQARPSHLTRPIWSWQQALSASD